MWKGAQDTKKRTTTETTTKSFRLLDNCYPQAYWACRRSVSCCHSQIQQSGCPVSAPWTSWRGSCPPSWSPRSCWSRRTSTSSQESERRWRRRVRELDNSGKDYSRVADWERWIKYSNWMSSFDLPRDECSHLTLHRKLSHRWRCRSGRDSRCN